MKEPVFLWVPMVLALSSYLVGMSYEGQIGSRFTFVHKGVLVIMQGCIEVIDQGLWIGLIDSLVGPIGLINKLIPILG